MKNETNPEPLALRLRDAAKALSISPRLLWQLTHEEQIPFVRPESGNHRIVLYPVEELKAWLRREVNRLKGAADGDGN